MSLTTRKKISIANESMAYMAEAIATLEDADSHTVVRTCVEMLNVVSRVCSEHMAELNREILSSSLKSKKSK
jgi:hypothetical protein